MEASVGDRITIESNHVGGGTRAGEVVEVVEDANCRRYRIRWDDGHETIFFPSGTAATIDHSTG